MFSSTLYTDKLYMLYFPRAYVLLTIGSKAFDFTTLLHTYYNVDIEKMKVKGLQGCNFIDKVNLVELKRMDFRKKCP